MEATSSGGDPGEMPSDGFGLKCKSPMLSSTDGIGDGSPDGLGVEYGVSETSSVALQVDFWRCDEEPAIGDEGLDEYLPSMRCSRSKINDKVSLSELLYE